MNKDEALKLAVEALRKMTPWLHPEEKSNMNNVIEALRKALAEKHECETCANKRKRLTDAGLLKSPLRSVDAIDTSESYVDKTEKREHEPVGTVLNVQWMSSTGGWEIGFHSKRKLFKGEALYTAPQEPWDTSDMAHRPGGLSMEQENEACGYAKRLAQAIWEKHYKEESPDWKPKNDVLGLLTQIDNMTCCLEKAQPEQELDYGVDRGAWSDVPDATKWLDELRGDDEPEPVLWKWSGDGWSYEKPMFQATPLYAAPPKREWVSLTDDEVRNLRNESELLDMFENIGWYSAPRSKFNEHSFTLIRAIEAALRSKNNG